MSRINIVPCLIKRALYMNMPQMPHIHSTAVSAVVQTFCEVFLSSVTNQHSPMFYQKSPLYVHTADLCIYNVYTARCALQWKVADVFVCVCVCVSVCICVHVVYNVYTSAADATHSLHSSLLLAFPTRKKKKIHSCQHILKLYQKIFLVIPI